MRVYISVSAWANSYSGLFTRDLGAAFGTSHYGAARDSAYSCQKISSQRYAEKNRAQCTWELLCDLCFNKEQEDKI